MVSGTLPGGELPWADGAGRDHRARGPLSRDREDQGACAGSPSSVEGAGDSGHLAASPGGSPPPSVLTSHTAAGAGGASQGEPAGRGESLYPAGTCGHTALHRALPPAGSGGPRGTGGQALHLPNKQFQVSFPGASAVAHCRCLSTTSQNRPETKRNPQSPYPSQHCSRQQRNPPAPKKNQVDSRCVSSPARPTSSYHHTIPERAAG